MKAFGDSEFEKHQAEAKEKWGQTPAYQEYAAKTKDYSKDQWNHLAGGMEDILAQFALCSKNGETPDSAEAQALVRMLQNHITQHYYRCTNEILAGLGQMYVSDPRFQANIDRHADGTAAFIHKAIRVYCGQ